jgi:Ricin-type beta-trefoil lectin domain-like
MSTFNFIKSLLDGNVIDIEGAGTATSGTHLDAFPQKPSSNDNQLWEFVPSSTSAGYFFIKSKLDGRVIDVKHANRDSGTFLQAYPQNAGETDNQLWKFVASDAYNYVFIKSKLNGDVIDIQGNSTAAGTGLDNYPQKSGIAKNQLWQIVPQPGSAITPKVVLTSYFAIDRPNNPEIPSGVGCAGSGFWPGTQVNIVFQYVDENDTLTTNVTTDSALGSVVTVDGSGNCFASLRIDTLSSLTGQLRIQLREGIIGGQHPSLVPFQITTVQAAYDGHFFSDVSTSYVS